MPLYDPDTLEPIPPVAPPLSDRPRPPFPGPPTPTKRIVLVGGLYHELERTIQEHNTRVALYVVNNHQALFEYRRGRLQSVVVPSDLWLGAYHVYRQRHPHDPNDPEVKAVFEYRGMNDLRA